MSWTNGDGLLIKFGTEPGVAGGTYGSVGEYMDTAAGLHCIEVVLTPMTALLTAASRLSETVTIPSGARIERVTTICETIVTGSSSTLNVGLQRLDRTTELDYDGFIAAAALTTMDAAGETNEYTVASGAGGALIGTTLTNPGYITADWDTAVFTAGKLVVRIFYRIPYVVQT